MRLSDEIFENLLWSLGSDDGARPDELRRTPRVGSSGIAMLFPIKDGRRDEGREVAIRDISAEGASLLLGSRLQVEQFILQLPSRRNEPVTMGFLSGPTAMPTGPGRGSSPKVSAE